MDQIMKQPFQLTLQDIPETSRICRALGNETRLQVLALLTDHAMSISELAAVCYLPLSSMCLHVKVLQEAGLISVVPRPGAHGTQKLCGITAATLQLDFFAHRNQPQTVPPAYTEMPVGHYSSCEVTPPCGLASEDSYLHYEDSPYGFYSARRTEAAMIWFTRGYLEYQFSNYTLQQAPVKQVEFTFEICSEAPGYNEDWPSDITLELNRRFICTITTKGDHGGRRGIYNPAWWSDSNTQYGEYKKIILTRDGCYMGEQRLSDTGLDDLGLEQGYHFFFTLRVDEKNRHAGGLNLFGRGFGDYHQGIVMKVVYF